MPSPVGDLRSGQSAGCAVGEEQLDLLAVHASASSSMTSVSVRRPVSFPSNAAANTPRLRAADRDVWAEMLLSSCLWAVSTRELKDRDSLGFNVRRRNSNLSERGLRDVAHRVLRSRRKRRDLLS